jgi:hypothetical protein
MADPVEIPTPGPDASPLDIFAAIATRLSSVGTVFEAEGKWLSRIVEFSRSLEATEEQIAEEIAKGWIDEEEAERKRTTDELHIPKANVDKHLQNIKTAVLILRDASRSIMVMIGKSEVPE